jgi:hypothetical protein
MLHCDRSAILPAMQNGLQGCSSAELVSKEQRKRNANSLHIALEKLATATT